MNGLKCVPWIAWAVAAYQMAAFLIPSFSHPGLAFWWMLGNWHFIVAISLGWLMSKLLHRKEALPEEDRDAFAAQISIALMLTASMPILSTIREDSAWPMAIAPIVVFLHAPIFRPFNLLLPTLLLAPVTIIALTAGPVTWIVGAALVGLVLLIHVIASLEDSIGEVPSP